MSRYVVWDKTSPVITPIGEVLTPAQWIDRYPVAEALKTVCAGGDINGAFFGVYSSMVQMYAEQGCDYTGCETDQDYLDAIEAFEDARNNPVDTGESTAEERIASALETQVMLSMTTVHEDDPDAE